MAKKEVTEKGFKLTEPTAPTPELPTYSASDAGKVLTVKSDGTLEWKTLS